MNPQEKNNRIKVGQIWEVSTETFYTTKSKTSVRPMKLSKGEKIEIRYPFAWHFRTEDNHYMHSEPEMILDNCILHGVIEEKIRFGNKANLEEILRLGLYDKVK